MVPPRNADFPRDCTHPCYRRGRSRFRAVSGKVCVSRRDHATHYGHSQSDTRSAEPQGREEWQRSTRYVSVWARRARKKYTDTTKLLCLAFARRRFLAALGMHERLCAARVDRRLGSVADATRWARPAAMPRHKNGFEMALAFIF